MQFFTVIAGVIITVVLLAVLIVLMHVGLWIQARSSGVNVSIPTMLMMRLRRARPRLVVLSLIRLHKAGIKVTREEMETFVLTGGNLPAVTEALISADKAGLDVNFQRLGAIDLAGRDILDAVESRVNPKVLLCPPANSGQHMITGVCKDGVRLGVKARITVRTQLDRLVGGAGAGTIVARVGEGIVAAIGRAATHMRVLEGPEIISAYLLEHGLDSGTCFEILSVDIADIEVMDNVGAKLQSAQAETDKRIAQAKAEIRRTAAVAAQHEMIARTMEMQGLVVAAKVVLPCAEASAFREANRGCPFPYSASVNDAMRWRLN